MQILGATAPTDPTQTGATTGGAGSSSSSLAQPTRSRTNQRFCSYWWRKSRIRIPSTPPTAFNLSASLCRSAS
jgi:hypothetical protein